MSTTTKTMSSSPMSSVVGENETVHLFVRELTVLDYAYFDDDFGPVGGSLDVDVTFVGDLDEEGVVFDFSLAKKAVKTVIDDGCDHRLVVPKKWVTPCEDGRLEVKATYGEGKTFSYKCPDVGLCILDVDEITVEVMRDHLEMEVMKVMPENVALVELQFRQEELGTGPSYRYTHGLKQHYGNCQRLLHGHRNRVDVLVNGRRSEELEVRVANLWENVHLAFPENIISEGFVLGQRQSQLDRIHLSYVSSQGQFDLDISGHEVYVMPYETTVENIARHLRDTVQSWVGSSDKVQVFAYEGIRKGAHSSTKKA
jgi:6-pyruvoyl-tetrahydropterin synthase